MESKKNWSTTQGAGQVFFTTVRLFLLPTAVQHERNWIQLLDVRYE
jgi:hypothetical protein